MKLARLFFAILSVSVFAACSADVTGPSSTSPSYDGEGTYGIPEGKP